MLFENDVTGTAPEDMFRHFQDWQDAARSTRELRPAARGRNAQSPLRNRRSDLAAGRQLALERMPAVDRNILRMALYEIRHEPETPTPVVIDEAIEIAKRFSTPRSSQFINGVLDGVLKAPEESKRP